MEKEGFSGFGVFLAFLGGAVAGAAVAMLVTPTTGEEARNKIKDLATNSKDKVQRMPKALKSAYAQASDVAKDAFNEAYQEVQNRT